VWRKLLIGRWCAPHPLRFLISRKTECGANYFLTRLAVRAAPFALLVELARKRECGANCS
jgi:hypothetical protein